MTANWKPFVRVRTTNGESNNPSEIVVSQITTGLEKRVIFQNELRVSVGKTRNTSSSEGSALVTFDTESPKGHITTSGTGRVELSEFSKPPKLKVKSKKHRRVEKYGLYAQIGVKQQDKEIVDGKAVEYFDLVFGRKDMARDNLPHFGFRPSGSSHFFVKTEPLGVTHESFGELMCDSGIIVPKKIVISLVNPNRKIFITFQFLKTSNELLADAIEII